MATQKLIVNNKSTANIPPNPDNDQKSSSGSSRTHSLDSVPESTGNSTANKQGSKQKPKCKGELTNKTHGIKKSKKERTFSCKECEFKSDSIKLLNEHHIEEHDPVPCTQCDHVSTTPSSHDHHMYKHKEHNFSCEDCEQSFAFSSELRAHKFSHRSERAFKCEAANCTKTFKSDTELQKHVKIHDGQLWHCDCCKYKTPDIRNLQKHMVKHTGK